MIHLAANPIYLGRRCIQRCFICGTLLADSLGAMMQVEENGDPPVFPTFPVGAWIQAIGDHSPTVLEVVGTTESPVIEFSEIPDGCCTEGEE